MIDRVIKKIKVNNRGVTMVEMIATFALLALFMVAATRIISYTIGIYYSTTGSTYGLAVSDMISQKIVGQIEGAQSVELPSFTYGTPIDGTSIDAITFYDKTGSKVTISADSDQKGYMNIKYWEVLEGSYKYKEVNWRFDPNAYMGYTVKGLEFMDPNEESLDEYPTNVLKMVLTLNSPKYGDYTSVNYIKCANLDEIDFDKSE